MFGNIGSYFRHILFDLRWVQWLRLLSGWFRGARQRITITILSPQINFIFFYNTFIHIIFIIIIISVFRFNLVLIKVFRRASSFRSSDGLLLYRLGWVVHHIKSACLTNFFYLRSLCISSFVFWGSKNLFGLLSSMLWLLSYFHQMNPLK